MSDEKKSSGAKNNNRFDPRALSQQAYALLQGRTMSESAQSQFPHRSTPSRIPHLATLTVRSQSPLPVQDFM